MHEETKPAGKQGAHASLGLLELGQRVPDVLGTRPGAETRRESWLGVYYANPALMPETPATQELTAMKCQARKAVRCAHMCSLLVCFLLFLFLVFSGALSTEVWLFALHLLARGLYDVRERRTRIATRPDGRCYLTSSVSKLKVGDSLAKHLRKAAGLGFSETVSGSEQPEKPSRKL